MAELKTKKTEASVEDFLNKVEDEQARKDCFEIVRMMKQATNDDAKMWGPAIVGCGSVRVKYPNGRELDWMAIGFSPRKQNLTLYLSGLLTHDDLLAKLGKYKTGKGCLYIKSLKDVDAGVLEQLIRLSVKKE